MSKLTVERGQEIAQENINIIYRLPRKYVYLNQYLSGPLRETLLNVLNFLKDKQIIIDQHKYLFFLSDGILTVRVRKKTAKSGTSNRHINLLCALGLFRKELQSKYYNVLIDVNRNFLENNNSKNPINVFSFRILTEKVLQDCEERAERLHHAGVTRGNMSFNYLVINGLEDIAYEIYPRNNKLSPNVKREEYQYLIEVIETCIDIYGYCNVNMIRDNLAITENELQRLRRIFKVDLAERYNYGRPTADQVKEWELPNMKYIYTRKDKEKIDA